ELARKLARGAREGIERRQEVRKARGVLGAMRLGPRDQLGWEAEPRRDGQRVALAGLVVAEAEGRGERRRVELHRGVACARVRGGEGLERLEVGRRDHERSPLGELLE